MADSPPSGSGNLNVQQGRQRLPVADPLQPLEPVQDPGNLVTMTIFLKDPRYDGEFLKARHEMFPDGKFPSSTSIG